MNPAALPTPACDAALAPLLPRVLAIVYEAVLLGAVLLCAGLLLGLLEKLFAAPHLRAIWQSYLICVGGAYFIWQWVRGGQTLPMKTWRLKLVTRSGDAVTLRDAFTRYVLALSGTALFGITFLWALVDRERLFLHDRLAGTRIVRAVA